MTEDEWLASTDLQMMLEYIQGSGSVSDRKLRLFAVACCRGIWPLLSDARSRRAVETSERYADRKVGEQELAVATRLACCVADEEERKGGHSMHGAKAAVMAALGDGQSAAWRAEAAQVTDPRPPFPRASRAARSWASRAALLRDIFGNPFRPVAVDRAWQTPGVVALAQAIYSERAFERMSVLANALEEARCADADMLAYCRKVGTHVRGCWVVDLLVGKE